MELDKQTNAPAEGQAEVSPEEQLGQMMMGDEQPEQVEEVKEAQEVQEEVKRIEVGGQEYTPEELAKQYSEARKRLSERSDKEKMYDQLNQAFEQNPASRKALQLAMQDENFQKVMSLYEQGYIPPQKVQAVMQKINGQSQQQPENNVQKMIDEKFQKIEQQNQIWRIQKEMQDEYQSLQSTDKYGEVIDKKNIDFDKLANFAAKHNIIDETGQKINMEKALNYYIADDPEALQMLLNIGANTAQQTAKAKKQAQVESSSNRQQKQQAPELPEWAQEALKPRPSGSGF